MALIILVAGSAAATHYRYGTLSWEPTGNGNEVLFTGGQAWRASAFGSPNVGAVVSGEGCLQTGDGACIDLYLKVNARSAINDWFSATFVDAFGNPGVRHNFSAPNDAGQPWAVSWGSCCRISQVSSGNYHVNNPDQSESLQTLVDLTAPPNSSPKSTLPPINACPFEALCTIPIPASDAEGDAMSFRLSTASEAGDAAYTPPGPPDATNAATIDASTGVLTWDTRGATIGASDLHTLYSVQVMIEDARTQTPLDFFVEILPEGVSPPYWVIPPTPCGQTLSVSAGSPMSFDVRAKSDDAGRIVYVNHLGLPTGAGFPPVTPGNPASGVFTWTPTSAQAGSHLVVFAAEDDLGYPAPACPVTINVDLHPPPVFTTPCGAPAEISGIAGVPISFPVAAQTINASRTVTISLLAGPAGLVFPTMAPANPASGVATWLGPYVGAPPAVFLAMDNFGVRATCIVPFDIKAPMGQAFTLATWAGTATPATLEYSSGGFDLRTTDADVPLRTRTIASVDHPQLGLRAEGIVEWASLDAGVGTMTARAGSKIALVSLANGAVVLHGLQQEATVTWDHTGATTSVTRNAQIDRMVVNGQEVAVPPGETLTIPLPGGHATIFERSGSFASGKVALADDLVRVYLAPETTRSEAILGSIILQGGIDVAFRQQARDILRHDDLRTGTDAGDDRATALDLATGVRDGNMPAGDVADAFVFDAGHGEKIVFFAQPAPGAYATGGSATATDTPPPSVVAPTVQTAPLALFRARLYDPLGNLREESLEIRGAASRVELNADITGEWLVVLSRANADPSTNYTVGLTITPVPLLPQADALVPGDAAPECVVGGLGIPTVGNGVWPGVVRDDDFADTYRFGARIGELVTVTLKPGEDVDGASMGIELYDRDCALLGSMMELTGLVKGEPRALLRLPSLYTGDYYVRIVRLNGVGNHYTEISVIDPHPSTSTNDALTGSDAPAYPASIAPPPVAFQGSIQEGDAGDAYRLSFSAGGTGVVGFSMSALSGVDVRLIAPGGYDVPMYAAVTDAGVVWRFEPDLAGDYVLAITPVLGGGNYSVTWGQLPARQP